MQSKNDVGLYRYAAIVAGGLLGSAWLEKMSSTSLDEAVMLMSWTSPGIELWGS